MSSPFWWVLLLCPFSILVKSLEVFCIYILMQTHGAARTAAMDVVGDIGGFLTAVKIFLPPVTMVLQAVALLHRMVTNVEDIRANQGSVDQRTTGVELNIRSKMGTEREDGSEPNPPKATKCASNGNQSSSSTQPEESTSASSRWQTALIW